MTTIMSWGNSSGTRGRCDARCHNAKGSKCKCMCGGKYHGSANRPGGVEQAVKDNWEEAIEDAEKKAQEQGMQLDTSRLRKFIGIPKNTPFDPVTAGMIPPAQIPFLLGMERL